LVNEEDEGRLCFIEQRAVVKRSAVLDDLETMWQAASRDNRRMLETMRRNERKLQQHLRACRSPGDVITVTGDAGLNDAL